MKKLIIAEKPSVARDIARVLNVKNKGEGFLYGDNEYVVTWAVGHLVSLCEPGEISEAYQKWTMATLPMLPDNIPLKVLPATASQFRVIEKLMRSSKIDSLICATDSAREGELIFRYIYQKVGCTKPVERLWISSMTDAAILEGFKHLKPSSAYDSLYESARCRSEADWIIGMNASRAFSLCYDAHLSVGRVQTPTLALIVKRDREIENFVPKEYWEVRADFGDYDGVWFNPNAENKEEDTRIASKAEAEKIRDAVKGQTGTVRQSTSEKKHFQPPQLFDLTTLQREANKKYGFSADKTLKLAQSLYETHKVITYPRTDSRYLPDDMRQKVKSTLQRLPEPYAGMVQAPEMKLDTYSKRYYDNSKISDHHAIVPTERSSQKRNFSQDEEKLFDMIVRRLIAIHYPDYEFQSSRVITDVNGHSFRSSGSTPLKDGWHTVYQETDDDSKGTKDKERPIPKLNISDTRIVNKVTVKTSKTKPPKAHTDASILYLMEHAGQVLDDEAAREAMKTSGLGTPATRAATIERLIQVGYARRVGKSIVSTEKGRQLIDVVPVQISSAATTGKWEKVLAELASFSDVDARNAKSARFMSGIRRFAEFLVDAAKNRNTAVHFEKETYHNAKKRTTTRRKIKSE